MQNFDLEEYRKMRREAVNTLYESCVDDKDTLYFALNELVTDLLEAWNCDSGWKYRMIRFSEDVKSGVYWNRNR